jgi:GNAT superfamily N-acetyltransferase
VPTGEPEIRRLDQADLEVLDRLFPVWSRLEYPNRLRAQSQDQLVQVVAWEADSPTGRGMVLFPEHDEFSASAVREGCAEVRDVFVAPGHRGRGIATAMMAALEDAAREHGMRRVGLAVGLDDGALPARILYERLGYRHAHGPYVTSTVLLAEDGPIPVGAVLHYLVKDL